MFKRGVEYTRDEVLQMVQADGPLRSEDLVESAIGTDDKQLIFLNAIGTPGKTGNDGDNHYAPENQTLIWFGAPNSHSSQPKFKKIIAGEVKTYFFARYTLNSPFIFLGTGRVISFTDDAVSRKGHKCIRFVSAIDEIEDVIQATRKDDFGFGQEDFTDSKSSFLLEKHLEDFIVTNWSKTIIGKQYDIYEKNGWIVGQQYRTPIGPIDILGLKKDKSDFLVLELKRDRASDEAVGQIMRYMGWIKEHLCSETQSVKGCIIASTADKNLAYALKGTPDIRFLKYEIDFRLVE